MVITAAYAYGALALCQITDTEVGCVTRSLGSGTQESESQRGS